LNKEELQKIIEQLESTNSKDEAYIGIFQGGEEPHDLFVKANRQGLELYAVQLLKASRDSEEVINDTKRKFIYLDDNDEWIQGDMFIQYIEPNLEKREFVKFEENKKHWFGWIFGAGCLALVLLIVISFFVGLGTIWNWIF